MPLCATYLTAFVIGMGSSCVIVLRIRRRLGYVLLILIVSKIVVVVMEMVVDVVGTWHRSEMSLVTPFRESCLHGSKYFHEAQLLSEGPLGLQFDQPPVCILHAILQEFVPLGLHDPQFFLGEQVDQSD